MQVLILNSLADLTIIVFLSSFFGDSYTSLMKPLITASALDPPCSCSLPLQCAYIFRTLLFIFRPCCHIHRYRLNNCTTFWIE